MYTTSAQEVKGNTELIILLKKILYDLPMARAIHAFKKEGLGAVASRYVCMLVYVCMCLYVHVCSVWVNTYIHVAHSTIQNNHTLHNHLHTYSLTHLLTHSYCSLPTYHILTY